MKRRSRHPKGGMWRYPAPKPTRQAPNWLWQYRTALVPAPVLAAVIVAGWVFAGRGFRFAFVGVFAAFVLFVVAAQRGRAWLPAAGLAAWLALTAAAGFGDFTRLVLVCGWGLWATAWWFGARQRITSALQRTWGEFVAQQGGALPGSKLVNERPAPRAGRAATIVLPRGQGVTEQAIASVGRVASAFQVAVHEVTIEPDPTGKAHLATLMLIPRPATMEVRVWQGPDLDVATGLSSIGVYIDGEPVDYRWWRESGPVHTLLAGTTDSGKSRLMDQLLATSRHGAPGLIATWVCDPQMGQSLPDWTASVDWFAAGTDAGLGMLRAAYAVMLWRNSILARRVWTDAKGRRRRGQAGFTPTPEMPLIDLIIEEAHTLLEIPEARDLVEKIAKMARKCGIKLTLIVQVPTLDQLGNSGTIREMVASGNVIVMRTGGRMSGQVAFQGTLAVEPNKLPKEMPDGSTSAGLFYMVGVRARQAPARSSFVTDPFHWASTGTTTAVDEGSATAAGYAYEHRHDWLSDDHDPDDAPPADPPVSMEKPSATVLPIRATCADLVLALLTGPPSRPMTREEIAVQCRLQGEYSHRQVRDVLRTLRETEKKVKLTDDGHYHLIHLTKGATT